MTKFKKGICIVAIIIIGIVIAGFVSSFFARETKTISAAAFSIGGIDSATGQYKKDEQSIYTKKMFECQGLRVEPDFESTVTYDVYYYDEDGRLLDSVLNVDGIYDEDHPFAKYARIVIHPDIEAELEEDESVKDWTVGYFSISRFANMLKITVSKDQIEYSANLFDNSKAQIGKSFNVSNVNEKLVITEATGMKVSNEIDIDGNYKYYDIFIKECGVETTVIAAVVLRADGTVVDIDNYYLPELDPGEWCKLTLDVRDIEDAAYILVRMPNNSMSECYIYGYNEK